MEAVCKVGRWGEFRRRRAPPRGSHCCSPSGTPPHFLWPHQEKLKEGGRRGGHPVMERQSESIRLEWPDWHMVVYPGLATHLFKR